MTIRCPSCRKLVAVGMICLCFSSAALSSGDDHAPERVIVQDLPPRTAVADYSGSQMPFRQMDWPNPIAVPYPNDLRTWTQGPSLALVTGSNA